MVVIWCKWIECYSSDSFNYQEYKTYCLICILHINLLHGKLRCKVLNYSELELEDCKFTLENEFKSTQKIASRHIVSLLYLYFILFS